MDFVGLIVIRSLTFLFFLMLSSRLMFFSRFLLLLFLVLYGRLVCFS